MGYGDWASSMITADIVSIILEEYFGYPTKQVEVLTTQAVTAFTQQTCDVLFEFWGQQYYTQNLQNSSANVAYCKTPW